MTNETAHVPAYTGEFDFTLESVILLVLGIFMGLFGLLLFSITTGALPYAPDSTYGLFLVIVALQVITMGKTPLGDLRRTWLVIILGIAAGITGMLACFIPGLLSDIVRILVGVILILGGAVLLLQLFFHKEKAAHWFSVPGILRHLTVACALVYFMAFLLGLVTLIPAITTNQLTAVLLIIDGAALFYLAWCIDVVGKKYPKKPEPAGEVREKTGLIFLIREVPLPFTTALLIFLGVLLTLLAILLVPVNLGTLPFSPDGQLGLLLVIMAIQILAMGETPLGAFKRSWFIVTIGLVFVAMGVYSCIVPGVLTDLLRVMLGLLNLIGSLVLLAGRVVPMVLQLRNAPARPVALPTPLRNLLLTQTALNIIGILFGISMLLPGFIPGMVTAAILFFNGLLLFFLAYILGTLPAAE
ncbi:MAG: hypothetical protein CVV30_03795 [Methanomicrobiales archaeon HGW-Methanomicrobiales-1]|jgi:uncharacterized membrane protein HdeD (DUF308 family)|nr:MAG: hypothetical protein CVV30_03795 [Methanomicrobiales archaeon HGW-Methanomicrobiales-1]